MDDERIYTCPACGDKVALTDTDDSGYYDETHDEGVCPHCGARCCFTCQHIYD